MNRTPKLDTKSNEWGAFNMTLRYQDKVEIYSLQKQSDFFKQFDINQFHLKYLARLIDCKAAKEKDSFLSRTKA